MFVDVEFGPHRILPIITSRLMLNSIYPEINYHWDFPVESYQVELFLSNLRLKLYFPIISRCGLQSKRCYILIPHNVNPTLPFLTFSKSTLPTSHCETLNDIKTMHHGFLSKYVH